MSSRRTCGYSRSQKPARSAVVCTARWLGASRCTTTGVWSVPVAASLAYQKNPAGAKQSTVACPVHSEPWFAAHWAVESVRRNLIEPLRHHLALEDGNEISSSRFQLGEAAQTKAQLPQGLRNIGCFKPGELGARQKLFQCFLVTKRSMPASSAFRASSSAAASASGNAPRDS